MTPPKERARKICGVQPPDGDVWIQNSTTAQQLIAAEIQAAQAEARKEALEEAAKIAEHPRFHGYTAQQIAAQIRALAQEGKTNDDQ